MTHTNRNKYLYIIIFSFILFGNCNEHIYQYLLVPHEWIILITFTLLSMESFLLKPNKFIITWVDKIFFIYLLSVVILPVLANINDLLVSNNAHIFVLFYPIKIWMVYRIFLFILMRNNSIDTDILKKQIDFILNIILLFSIISGFIGLLRYVGPDEIISFINYNWPIKGVPDFDYRAWKRLVGTMSGTNGGGIFFVICAIISLFKLGKYKKYRFLMYSIFFSFLALLTGSFTATIMLVVCLPYYLHKSKMLQTKHAIVFLLISVIFFILAINLNPTKILLYNVIERRGKQFKSPGGGIRVHIPASFQGRYRDWILFYKYFEEKPLLGFGFKEGAIGGQDISARSTLSENYYVELLIYSGIIGLSAYILMMLIIFRKLKRLKQFTEERTLIKTIIYIYLITQITQLTLYYTGFAEFFGIMLALIFMMCKIDKTLLPVTLTPVARPFSN